MSSTPAIHISQHQRRNSPPTYPALPVVASPMAVPRAREPVPPPLPPPAHIPELYAGRDPGWQWGNDPNAADFGKAAWVKPGSSLLGSTMIERRQKREQEGFIHEPYQETRRGSSLSTVTLEREQDMKEDSSTTGEEAVACSRRTSTQELHGVKELERQDIAKSSHSYDQQQVNRFGGPPTPKRLSVSSIHDNGGFGPTDLEGRRNSLRPLSMQERRHASVDSPFSAKWPSSGAISPGYTGFWAEQTIPENGRPLASQHSSLTFDDYVSRNGSYDHSMFVNDELYMEEGQMSNLHLQDRSPGSPKAGTKRRASSPPRDLADREDRSSVSSASGQSDIVNRRLVHQLPNRGSPISRFHPNHSSLSSASSLGPRHNSFGSSLGVSSVPSSATSYASGRVSPSGLSPSIDLDFRQCASQAGLKPLTSGSTTPHHSRNPSASAPNAAMCQSPGSAPHSRNSSVSQMSGVYFCECCPKKPRKFDSEDELRAHEAEKQYTCAYCSNRFKNKNEAERHQNSLHLRRHSWLCAALTQHRDAFHQSPSSTNVDVCGYCGEGFPNNPAQWDARAEHLNIVHKFGECNKTKKFFRADHFRQHLKHSHQGTSGKWTNHLENACMQDEPPPEKRTSPGAAPVSARQAPILMVTTTGLPAPGQPASGVIVETPHDS